MIKFLIQLLFVVLLFPNQPIDGVVAVVGNRTILRSELLQQAQFVATQQNINPSTSPYLFEEVVSQTLNSMVDQFVVLCVAEKDTNIIISSDEVSRALDQQINDFIRRAGSESSLESALGMTLREIRNNYRNEVFDMLLGERFQHSLFGDIGVTKKEVIAFYDFYKDSLPASPPAVLLSLIEIPVLPSQIAIDSAVLVLDSVLIKLNSGVGFEDLASLYSEDPGSMSGGGNLGFTKRGTLVKEYEEVAFSLEKGEVSRPFRSPFGYHVVQLIEKQGEKIHTRHILRLVSPTLLDREKTLSEINLIYHQTNNDPGLFDSLAVEYSLEFKNKSVSNISVDPSSLPASVSNVVDELVEYSLSEPFLFSNNSFGLAYVYNKKPAGFLSLENSWEEIKGFAKNKKVSDEMEVWLEGARSQVYIKFFEK